MAWLRQHGDEAMWELYARHATVSYPGQLAAVVRRLLTQHWIVACEPDRPAAATLPLFRAVLG